MTDTKQVCSTGRIKKRGSRGKKKSKKQPSTTSATSNASQSPPKSPSLPLITSATSTISPETVRSILLTPSTDSSANTSTNIQSTLLFAGSTLSSAGPSFSAPSIRAALLASLPFHHLDPDYAILIDLPLTAEELHDWERGIRIAGSPARRAKWSAMLREEILLRGVEGMEWEMVELVAQSYY